MNDANTHCLYDAQELDEVLACMARQLAVFFHGQPFAMVGILRRGVPWRLCCSGITAANPASRSRQSTA